MPDSEERIRVLQMIAEGKITANEGARLLEAMRAADQSSSSRRQTAEVSPQWLHLRLSDPTSGQVKTDVSIPLSIVQIGLELGLRLTGNDHTAEVDQLVRALQEGREGKLLEAIDKESGQRLEIFIE